MLKHIRTDYDKDTGVTEEFWYNEVTDEMTIKRYQDVEAVIDTNKNMFNSHNRVSYGDSNGNHLVARIPLILVEVWKNEHGFDWFASSDRERRAWLDKPEHAFLKVRPGKLSGTTPNRLVSKKA